MTDRTYVKIPLDVLNDVAAYLVTKPYHEVKDLIQDYTKLQIELLKRDIEELQKATGRLYEEIKELKEERTHLLKWGLITLGGAVVALGTYIWSVFNGHGPS